MDVEIQQTHLPFYTKLWFWWVLLTAIYLGLFFSGSLGSDTSTSLGYITGFIGLFVPIGLFTSAGIYSEIFERTNPSIWTAIAVIVFFASFYFDSVISKYFHNRFIKILTCLFILLLVTLIINLAIFGTWASMRILEEGRLNIRF